MQIKFNKYIREFIKKFIIPQSQISYSQFGEDLIFSLFFSHNEIHNPTYLDIGANEPKYISNTYYFYERGSTGVLIEPNPFLYKKLKMQRPKDIILNIGIGFTDVKEADFYMFPNYANGLSTFSENEAKHWEEIGMKGLGKIPVEKIIKMPLIPINSILEKYWFDFNSKNYAIALGLGSLFNHSVNENVMAIIDEKNNVISFKALKDILPKEQLFLNYGYS